MAGKGRHKTGMASHMRNKGRPMPDPYELLKRARLGPGLTVVDFGCGLDGEYAMNAAEIVGESGRVLAVGNDSSRLANIRKKSLPDWLEIVEQKDFILSERSGEFDFGILCYTFFSIKRVAKFLGEVNRLLKMNAGLLLVDWRKVEDGFPPPKKMRLARGDAHALLERAGFDVHDAEFLDSSNYILLASKDENVERVNLYVDR
ncbi:MAG: methyltransferase domain-containing protein [Deltaproteobacteria bacterium]|nr:methyltransferase domain-containing protein [Deltaproteobacteria bacterium]